MWSIKTLLNFLKFPLEAYQIIRRITYHNKNCAFAINVYNNKVTILSQDNNYKLRNINHVKPSDRIHPDYKMYGL